MNAGFVRSFPCLIWFGQGLDVLYGRNVTMMKEIEVMVADASHEKYVDTILDTMAAAARCAERVLPAVAMSIWQPR